MMLWSHSIKYHFSRVLPTMHDWDMPRYSKSVRPNTAGVVYGHSEGPKVRIVSYLAKNAAKPERCYMYARQLCASEIVIYMTSLQISASSHTPMLISPALPSVIAQCFPVVDGHGRR
eukprot:TRINITY_DN738_c0_g1_i1.p2 TRINITY_DN738_c0_g1~~TRINITY_DN738_c0_g1_i1.p2  ORF type:complete len:117 (+),score=10.07 TRINITY_DN738_c0_g1_i1:1475-1825(+)